MKVFLIIWRTILISLTVFIFIWLISLNLFTSGHWFIERDFCQPSRVVSDLYPQDRVIKKDCSFRIIYEPVYFRVKLPVMFERVRVELIYATKEELNLSLGLLYKRIRPTDWQFELKELKPKSLENNIFEATAEFFIHQGFLNDYNLEFMISAPKVRDGNYLEIKKINIELVRRPLTWQEVLSRSFAYLKDLF
jgi:hypothetical protein